MVSSPWSLSSAAPVIGDELTSGFAFSLGRLEIKAGDGGRTHDVKLGKLAFYR